MSTLYLTNAVTGQSSSIASATTSSIGYGTNSTTPLTINSQAGIQFCNNSGGQLGTLCNISSTGVFNCSGLTIAGPLTCSSLIIPNNGTITCLGNLNCNNTLNMNNNAITNVGSLACIGTLNMNSNAITNVGSLSPFGTLGSNIKSVRCINWTIGAGDGTNKHKYGIICSYGVTYPDPTKLFFNITPSLNYSSVVSDTFSVTIISFTSTTITFNVVRTDTAASWGNPSLCVHIIITEIV